MIPLGFLRKNLIKVYDLYRNIIDYGNSIKFQFIYLIDKRSKFILQV